MGLGLGFSTTCGARVLGSSQAYLLPNTSTLRSSSRLRAPRLALWVSPWGYGAPRCKGVTLATLTNSNTDLHLRC